jgi:hypothetical protein
VPEKRAMATAVVQNRRKKTCREFNRTTTSILIVQPPSPDSVLELREILIKMKMPNRFDLFDSNANLQVRQKKMLIFIKLYLLAIKFKKAKYKMRN